MPLHTTLSRQRENENECCSAGCDFKFAFFSLSFRGVPFTCDALGFLGDKVLEVLEYQDLFLVFENLRIFS